MLYLKCFVYRYVCIIQCFLDDGEQKAEDEDDESDGKSALEDPSQTEQVR